MAYIKPDVIENHLLEGLPRKDRLRILANSEKVMLESQQMLYEPLERIKYVYFPLDCFASIIATTNGKERLEVGMIGNEGMLGVSMIIGVEIPLLYTMVQGPGMALRMKTAVFKRELEESKALRRRLQDYLYVVMRQMAQTASCMRFHLVEARLARWLLMTQDRTRSDVLHLTQEFLSYMLGVRRVGISKAATSLQQRRLISYSRGEIRILDRPGLIAASCSCYQADNEHYTQMIDKPVIPRTTHRIRTSERYRAPAIAHRSLRKHLASGSMP